MALQLLLLFYHMNFLPNVEDKNHWLIFTKETGDADDRKI